MDIYHFSTVRVDDRGTVVARPGGAARRRYEDLGGGLRLALIALPGGTFRMGSPPGQGFPDEHPQHTVSLAPFWLGQYPVTQAQWAAVMDRGKAFRGPGADHPANNISWDEAMAFCRRLSALTGRPYTLPGEAQWEYACRGPGTLLPPAPPGDKSSVSSTDPDGEPPFGFGGTLTSDLANYVGEVTYGGEPAGVYRHGPIAVGSFPPNGFGLHDLHGQVWEWCTDAWHGGYDGAPADGRAWEAGGEAGYRVARGGSWHDGPDLCRSAARLRLAAAEGEDYVGFRAACA